MSRLYLQISRYIYRYNTKQLSKNPKRMNHGFGLLLNFIGEIKHDIRKITLQNPTERVQGIC